MEVEAVHWQTINQFQDLVSGKISILYGVEKPMTIGDAEVLLSQDELQKADRMIASQRLNWMTAHATLRFFCGLLLQKSPLEVDFLLSENGKPYIKNSPFHFNLSHTDHSFAIAFSSSLVGIDLESMSASFELKDVVEYAFSAEEKKYCENGADRARFFAVWTAKEALSKAIGSGLPDQMKTFSVIGSGLEVPHLSGFVRKTFLCPNNEIATLVNHSDSAIIQFLQFDKNFPF
jgi:4'-phosphopantetheinyl transferase